MKNTIKLSYNHFMTPKTLAEAADDRDIIGIFSISKKDPSKLSVKEDIGDLMIISDNATTKGVTVYVIPDKAMPDDSDSDLNVELIQPLSAIRDRLSEEDYVKYLKGELW